MIDFVINGSGVGNVVAEVHEMKILVQGIVLPSMTATFIALAACNPLTEDGTDNNHAAASTAEPECPDASADPLSGPVFDSDAAPPAPPCHHRDCGCNVADASAPWPDDASAPWPDDASAPWPDDASVGDLDAGVWAPPPRPVDDAGPGSDDAGP